MNNVTEEQAHQSYDHVERLTIDRPEKPIDFLYDLIMKTAVYDGATETSRNITARVIERGTSGEIYYFLEDSRGFRTRQHGHQ
ncbi:hypothetical protein TNCV_3251001 [Trichonephila clavipes]|nr:hypothetical protein TNCV_3251001 [Trichonephila clavipes]